MCTYPLVINKMESDIATDTRGTNTFFNQPKLFADTKNLKKAKYQWINQHV